MPSRLEELMAAATPRPWPAGYIYWSLRQVEKSGCEGVYAHLDGTEMSDEESGRCPQKEDAVFIATAINALPDLLAVVDAARKFRDQVFDYKTIHNHGTHVEAHIRVNTLAEFDKALTKLDEVQP